MIRRIPVGATIIVLVAVGVMVRLGLWQLDRKAEKEALIARFELAERSDTAMAWPDTPAQVPARLYHQTRIDCARPLRLDAIAGRNDRGETGWANVLRCGLRQGGEADIVIGWSRDPATARFANGDIIVRAGKGVAPPEFRGPAAGEYRGTIAPGADETARLVASVPFAGLGGNARPDPAAIANNHLSYAVQWFLFAATALAIYALALRKRLAA